MRNAQFACYVLVNKIVFHEALLKRYRGVMQPLDLPEHITTGDDFRIQLAAKFRSAISATGDYETVFGESHSAFGETIPFKADAAIPHWRGLLEQIHKFDFSKLDYEVIGNIFERLIAPEERKKYGQYYTRVEVADLINSFCIREGNEKVLDPACGGGTFLVRAYSRKREMFPEHTHIQHLRSIFGIDIERFAAHLSTINLATRDLVDSDNYPQIARSDFFDVTPEKEFLQLPYHVGGNGPGKREHHSITIKDIDAVVGNPPYIRQEEIEQTKKKRYRKLAWDEQRFDPSGRSDIHVYFWPHAASFLKPGGYLGLITSSQWLDVEYGFKLQKWILENFRIVAIFESIDEPWFVGARVATAVTILQLEPDAATRMGNVVRFVQMRKPVKEIMAHDGSLVEALRSADYFRDEIINLDQNAVNERYRARLINQGDLWREGVKLGVIMGKSEPEDDREEDGQPVQSGEYYGGKWGVYLRAPDFWFKLVDEYGDKLAPLGELARVRFGVKSGKDEFFFPIDCSAEMLNRVENADEFKTRFGATRKEIESGDVKLVRCGEGRKIVKPVESAYLVPAIHSIMDIDGYVVKPENRAHFILVVKTRPRNRVPKYVRAYLNWGEELGYHTGKTCLGRVSNGRDWYDLSSESSSKILWAKERHYRQIAPFNPLEYIANCRLYKITPNKEGIDEHLAASLNTTLALLSCWQYGRPVGNEGAWSTMVSDTSMMPVPDVSQASNMQLRRIKKAFNRMMNRNAMQFLSEQRLRAMAFKQQGKYKELDEVNDRCELDMPDRRELDDAVLEMMGVENPAKRKELIDELYAYLRQFFEATRQKEEEAIKNKKRTARRGQSAPYDVAVQIYKEIQTHHGWLFDLYYPQFHLPVLPSVDVVDIPKDAGPAVVEEVFHGYRVSYKVGRNSHAVQIDVPYKAQAELIRFLTELGFNDLTFIPHTEEGAKLVLANFRGHFERRVAKLQELVEERTLDPGRQEKILAELNKMLRL